MFDDNHTRNDVKIGQVLKNFKATTPGVLGCTVSTTDGYLVASELARSIKDERVAVLAAALIWVGQQTTQDLVQGPLQRVYIEGEFSDVIVMGAGPESLLCALVSKDAKFGLVCFQMQRVAKELTEIALEQTIFDSNSTPLISGVDFAGAASQELDRLTVGG